MTTVTVSKIKLSGSTDGKGIKVVHTSSGTADTIHQAQSGQVAGNFDEIWLYAINNDTVTRLLSLGFGGLNAEDTLNVNVGPQGDVPICIVNGWPLQNALYVKAWCAAAANVITIFGFVNKITEA